MYDNVKPTAKPRRARGMTKGRAEMVHVFHGHNEKQIKNFHRGQPRATRNDWRMKPSPRVFGPVYLLLSRDATKMQGTAGRLELLSWDRSVLRCITSSPQLLPTRIKNLDEKDSMI